MPIYEYECGECGHKLEVLQRISDPRLTTCPSCSKEALKKLVSAAGFQLKGTGWYETDFKNKGKPQKKAEGDGDKAAKSTSDEGKSTAKTGSDTKSASAAGTSD
ncbi:MAG: zinc ribbon domain-containing protein [Gammaproteobacteria bacterium]|nr:zinc ribbon domain-containing protein [Gammaproteobacteria bacterium]